MWTGWNYWKSLLAFSQIEPPRFQQSIRTAQPSVWAIDENTIHVEYIHNSKKRADGFSKPYDPKDHTQFVSFIQGRDQ
jgi:hypothetical protein